MPVCGYYTVERDLFEICSICFWEDDGQDDFSVNENSGPNHMTLAEGREIFFKAKQQLLYRFYPSSDFRLLKQKILILDNLIAANTNDIDQVTMLQDEIIAILDGNNIYGLDTLFNR